MDKRFLVGSLTTAVIAAVAITFVRASDAQQPASSAPAALTAADTADLKGPRQPVFFRHDIHAGQQQIDCQYCHSSVAVSSEPGIPSMQTCMGCHAALIPGSTDEHKAEIQKVKDAWTAGEPIEWVRIHSVARHVRFPHMRHIKALGDQACATCHGNVARMPQVYEVNNVNNMGFCINCHLERNVTRDCTACHF